MRPSDHDAGHKSWTPVRRGKIFCSPACGGGCTKADYDRRMRDGVRLAKRLGEGWRYELNENLGWYMKVLSPCGRIGVHANYDHKRKDRIDHYSAYLNAAGELGGRWVGTAKTPEAAVADAIAAARTTRNEINAILDGIDVYVPGSIQAASQRARLEAILFGTNDDGGLP